MISPDKTYVWFLILTNDGNVCHFGTRGIFSCSGSNPTSTFNTLPTLFLVPEVSIGLWNRSSSDSYQLVP